MFFRIYNPKVLNIRICNPPANTLSHYNPTDRLILNFFNKNINTHNFAMQND